MSTFRLLTRNRTASGTINPYRIVKVGAADGIVVQASAATDKSVGVSNHLGADDGERIDCEFAGIVGVQLGETVARGTPITSDANGKGVAASIGDRVIGITIEGGDADEIVETLLAPSDREGQGGTYAPAVAGTANVDSVNLVAARFMRVGDIVHVDVELSVDPTAAAPTATQVSIELPIASVLVAATDLGGVATIEGGGIAGSVKGDVATAKALLDFSAGSAAAQTWRASFSYTVLS